MAVVRLRFICMAIEGVYPELMRLTRRQKRSHLPFSLSFPAVEKPNSFVIFQVIIEPCLESIPQDRTSFIHCSYQLQWSGLRVVQYAGQRQAHQPVWCQIHAIQMPPVDGHPTLMKRPSRMVGGGSF